MVLNRNMISGQRGLGILDGVRAATTPARDALRSGISTARSGIQTATRGVTFQRAAQDIRSNVRSAITGEEAEEAPTYRQPSQVGYAGPGGRQFQFQSTNFVDPAGVRAGKQPTTRRIVTNTDL